MRGPTPPRLSTKPRDDGHRGREGELHNGLVDSHRGAARSPVIICAETLAPSLFLWSVSRGMLRRDDAFFLFLRPRACGFVELRKYGLGCGLGCGLRGQECVVVSGINFLLVILDFRRDY